MGGWGGQHRHRKMEEAEEIVRLKEVEERNLKEETLRKKEVEERKRKEEISKNSEKKRRKDLEEREEMKKMQPNKHTSLPSNVKELPECVRTLHPNSLQFCVPGDGACCLNCLAAWIFYFKNFIEHVIVICI